ncbi:uncharacterized protein DFL_003972 [Arthrobotrys flagrans]|uniref:ML-like domain-containing protein n=1 Tax=Arthrobotrys flagrans TaxID=97331 RepID=A0A437A3C1_ARTFL|nr:hypothetical protein DFL_003972 [Arthrobotrys flagrans]
MLFSLLPPAVLLLSASFVTAKTEDFTLTLFPAIPEVTEIAANSSLVALVKETGAASTNYGINAKRAKPTGTATAVATSVNTDFYIDVTTYPNQKSQVLNYFTGAFPFTQVAEVTCSFEGTTSAVCQVTRLAEETGPAIAPGSLTSSEVRYAPAQMTFQPIVFKGVPVDSSAGSLRILGVPALVASSVAVYIMLL